MGKKPGEIDENTTKMKNKSKKLKYKKVFSQLFKKFRHFKYVFFLSLFVVPHTDSSLPV